MNLQVFADPDETGKANSLYIIIKIDQRNMAKVKDKTTPKDKDSCYFGYGRAAILKKALIDLLSADLTTDFENRDIPVNVVDAESKIPSNAASDSVMITLSTGDLNELIADWRIGKAIERQDIVYPQNNEDRQQLEKTKDSLPEIMKKLSRQIVDKISVPLFKGIYTSRYKIRVFVDDMIKNDSEKTYPCLGSQLKQIIKASLSNTRTMLLFEDSAEAEYIIKVEYFLIGKSLRADIRVQKKVKNRILTNKTAVIDDISTSQLSSIVTEKSLSIVREIEADFEISSKTVAVVAPPLESYIRKHSNKSLMKFLPFQIARAITRKLKILVSDRDLPYTCLDLEIVPETVLDSNRVQKGQSFQSSLMAELGCSYLVYVATEDYGNQLRMIVTLYSRENEFGTEYLPVFEALIDKTDIDDYIDSASIIIADVLSKKICTSAAAITGLTAGKRKKDLEKISVPDFRMYKRAGFRTGMALYRCSPSLYMGKESGNMYFEGYYNYLLPGDFRIKSFTIDRCIGPTLGAEIFDLKSLRTLPFRGVNAANGFLQITAILTNYQYARVPFSLILGSGVGVYGIRYRFLKGDDHFYGADLYDKFQVTGAFKFSGDVNFAITDRLSLSIFLAQITGLSAINKFKDAPLTTTDDSPHGSIVNFYGTIGLQYSWR